MVSWLVRSVGLLALLLSCGCVDDKGPAVGTGKGGSGNVAAGKGDFSDYWKRRSVHVTAIDPTNPSAFTDETFELPDRIKNPVDGRELDMYIQIKGDSRYTYALFEGDEVYYRMITKVTQSDETYFESTGGDSQIFQLEDGVLKDMRISLLGSYSVTAESTYEKASKFPPSDWPEKMLDTVELMQ